jgi:methyl-accepting chemotaxis protein
MTISTEWIGIILSFGGIIMFAMRLYSKVETMQKMFELLEKSRGTEREDFREFKNDMKGMIAHLENTIKQGQTSLRIIIDEHTKDINLRIDDLQSSMHTQHKELSEKILHVERQMNEHRDETNNKIIEHLTSH